MSWGKPKVHGQPGTPKTGERGTNPPKVGAQSQDPWRVHDLVRSKPLDLIRYERATLCFKNHSTPKRFERKR